MDGKLCAARLKAACERLVDLAILCVPGVEVKHHFVGIDQQGTIVHTFQLKVNPETWTSDGDRDEAIEITKRQLTIFPAFAESIVRFNCILYNEPLPTEEVHVIEIPEEDDGPKALKDKLLHFSRSSYYYDLSLESWGEAELFISRQWYDTILCCCTRCLRDVQRRKGSGITDTTTYWNFMYNSIHPGFQRENISFDNDKGELVLPFVFLHCQSGDVVTQSATYTQIEVPKATKVVRLVYTYVSGTTNPLHTS